MIPIIQEAKKQRRKTAVIDAKTKYTYEELLAKSQSIAFNLLKDKKDLKEARVAFMAVANTNYVLMQWAIWQAGGIAVPVSVSHPLAEIEYILEDTKADILIFTEEYQEFLKPLASKALLINLKSLLLENKNTKQLPEISAKRKALIIYTSGTTNKPKGVVTSHEIITSQIATLVEAWEWTSKDYIINILPLHHVHGIINVLSCAFWVGATCEMLEKFEAKIVWEKFKNPKLTLFMAVPTIYNRLISYWENSTKPAQKVYSEAVQKLRLMVSGSAALPIKVLEKWQEISKHTLLERYGMTEIGMAISNPLKGERKAGFVGKPLPKVEVKLLDEQGKEVLENYQAGEIHIKSPSVFLEYWQKPEASRESFVNTWFKTGDIAERDEEGYFRILGRNSVDIIKTGGYKVSALEIENVLKNILDNLSECAVVGILDEDWGEKIVAFLVLKNKKETILKETLRTQLKEYLAHYKVPSEFVFLAELPKNAMGKVVKPSLKKLYERL